VSWSGRASGAQRYLPAKSAYGGTNATDEEAAFDASLAAGVNFFDTAALYSAGASERRLGELAQGKDVVIASKFPPNSRERTQALPAALDASLGNLGGAQSICTNIIFRHPGWISRLSWA
jgi:aryl-alcohol dehydrogenase-like predicted oxidoreductase